MRKYLFLAAALVLFFSVGLIASAKQNTVPRVSLPDQAKEIAPGVFNLGEKEYQGRLVQGYAFLRYKDGYVKPGTECGNGICEPGENARKCPADCGEEEPSDGTESCYGFLARGAKWKSVEPYVVNPSNDEGLGNSFVAENFSSDIDKWEEAASFDIVGSGSVTNQIMEADLNQPDDQNEVYFGDVDQPGAIAITIVWGYFGGPPQNRELIEWDQVYDQVDFDWSDSGEADKMDFENIATHELGHTMGMDDLYVSSCYDATMYGYARDGEVYKRDLADGDQIGVAKLYQ